MSSPNPTAVQNVLESDQLRDIAHFLTGRHAGASAQTIAAKAIGVARYKQSLPADADDRSRCIRLLRACPWTWTALDALAVAHAGWAEQAALIRAEYGPDAPSPDALLSASTPTAEQPTPHHPIAGDAGVTLWNSPDCAHVARISAAVKIDGQLAATFYDGGDIEIEPADDAWSSDIVPRRVANPSHDPAKLAAFAADYRLKRDAAKPPESAKPAGAGEKPLWVEGDRYRLSQCDPLDREWYVQIGEVLEDGQRQPGRGSRYEGRTSSITTIILNCYLATGYMVPVNRPVDSLPRPQPPSQVSAVEGDWTQEDLRDLAERFEVRGQQPKWHYVTRVSLHWLWDAEGKGFAYDAGTILRIQLITGEIVGPRRPARWVRPELPSPLPPALGTGVDAVPNPSSTGGAG